MPKITWTDEDTERLLQLRLRGLTSRQIAIAMGRTRDAVCGKLERLVASGTLVPASRFEHSGGWPKPRPAPPLIVPLSDADRRRYDNWKRARDAAREALRA